METLFYIYLTVSIMFTAVSLGVSIGLYFSEYDVKKCRKQAKSWSMIFLLSPALPVLIVYGLYKYITKIVMYKESK